MDNPISQRQLEDWMKLLNEQIRSKEEALLPLQQELANLRRQREALRVLAVTSPSEPKAGQREDSGVKSVRGGDGSHTPTSAFRRPLMESLAGLGGKGEPERVIAMVESKMSGHLTAKDRELLPSGGELRWRNSLRWARKELVDRGDLRSDSPRGVWELSDQGWGHILDDRG